MLLINEEMMNLNIILENEWNGFGMSREKFYRILPRANVQKSCMYCM